jgi:hypothetical protein
LHMADIVIELGAERGDLLGRAAHVVRG